MSPPAAGRDRPASRDRADAVTGGGAGTAPGGAPAPGTRREGAPLSLQRRLLLYLLICAPLVWAATLAVSVNRARHEVNELFDTEMIHLARQVQVTLPAPSEASAVAPMAGDLGESDMEDFAIAAWDGGGALRMSDREGVMIPHEPDATGFRNRLLKGEPWRIYYLQSEGGGWLVASAQKLEERDELVWNLTLSQVLPWVAMLPVLLAGMGWAVKQALAPLRRLTQSVEGRSANELEPLSEGGTPAELRPLVRAMNRLFDHIQSTLAHERRFTADAAHELRTPISVLRAQWDVVRRAADPVERAASEAKLTLGLDRLDRLVTQMLALARLDGGVPTAAAMPVRWEAVVEHAVSDCLALAERRRIEIACDWPPAGAAPLPLAGDAHLLTVMLRNLLDNAVRYAPEGTTVQLRVGPSALTVDNDGAPLAPELLPRLGERFFRPAGQEQSGSGLGISIVRRIAELHGLAVEFSTVADGRGVRASVTRPGVRAT